APPGSTVVGARPGALREPCGSLSGGGRSRQAPPRRPQLREEARPRPPPARAGAPRPVRHQAPPQAPRAREGGRPAGRKGRQDQSRSRPDGYLHSQEMLGRVVPGGSRRFPSWFPEPVPRFPSLIGNREPEPPSGTTSPRNHLAGHSVAFVLRLTGEDPAAIFEFQLALPPQIFEVGGSRLLSHLEERP